MIDELLVDEMARELAGRWMEGKKGTCHEEKKRHKKEEEAAIAPGATGSQICRE